MTMESVSFNGKLVEAGGRNVELDYPIQEAFREDGRTIVLFDPDSASGAFRNLICLGENGETLWVAELPEGQNQDVYYCISTRRPLVVNSFSSYKCEIDTATGKIVGSEFVK